VTRGREGFVHPYQMGGNEEAAEVSLILRSFDESELRSQEARLRELAEQAARPEPRATWDLEVTPQYRNMAETLRRHPHVVERAAEAMRRATLTPRTGLIRGGTDGSILSNRGLPCPNLSSGQHRIHSNREWLCARELGQAAETVVHLAAIWAGR
jgi:tripeptide aminopeptidase